MESRRKSVHKFWQGQFVRRSCCGASVSLVRRSRANAVDYSSCRISSADAKSTRVWESRQRKRPGRARPGLFAQN